MKFMLTFAIKPETRGRDEAIRRFRQTGGQPPAGAKLISRYTATDMSGGFVILESNDSRALTHYALMWTDVIEFKLVPVVEDAELVQALELAGH